MRKKEGPEVIDMTEAELKALQERIKNKKILDEDYPILDKTIDFVIWVQIKLLHAKISMRNLKSLIFGSASNKNKKNNNFLDKSQKIKTELSVGLEQALEEATVNAKEPCDLKAQTQTSIPLGAEAQKKEGHGRIAAAEYLPETVIEVKHPNLNANGPCPTDFCEGKLYGLPITPGGIIRIKGCSCAHIVSYRFHRLRCALCGTTFTPDKPEGFSEKKYDEHFKAILAVNKYFLATPFFRQESYYDMLGLSMSDATQWDCIKQLAEDAAPIYSVLEKIAADCPKINYDDTHVKILSVIKDNKKNPEKKRTGSYTTSIIARSIAHEIHIYYSGTAHGGENFNSILKKRDPALGPVKQMCDALAANTVSKFDTILSNCLAHGHRKFKELEDFFPQECSYVMERFKIVFKNDSHTKKERFSDEQRLEYHKNNSAIPMEELRLFIEAGVTGKEIEKNSPLGKAIRYIKNHWHKFIRFLSVAGVDIDNNIVERALKLAIRIRKNALFYKTESGAQIAALLLTLIITADKSNKNPINYLTALQKNKAHVAFSPQLWLPWNYEETVLNLALEKIPKAP